MGEARAVDAAVSSAGAVASEVLMGTDAGTDVTSVGTHAVETDKDASATSVPTALKSIGELRFDDQLKALC